MSGTSMASPAVAGCVALLLAAAKAKQRSLSIDEIRAAVLESARATSTPGVWHDRLGMGHVTAAGMINHLNGQ